MENVNNEVIQTAEELVENYEAAEVTNGSFGKTFIGVCLAGIAVGIIAKVIHKNKDKICNWAVNKLGKAGYVYSVHEVPTNDHDDWFDRFEDDDDDYVVQDEETGE